jgi:hypothetical protein
VFACAARTLACITDPTGRTEVSVVVC